MGEKRPPGLGGSARLEEGEHGIVLGDFKPAPLDREMRASPTLVPPLVEIYSGIERANLPTCHWSAIAGCYFPRSSVAQPDGSGTDISFSTFGSADTVVTLVDPNAIVCPLPCIRLHKTLPVG